MGCTTSRKTLPQFVLFGDSLTEWGFSADTQGFGWHLQDSYKGKAEIINKGYAGYTSERIKPEFTHLISQLTSPSAPKTLLFTIFLGANDACFVGDGEYVPLAQFSDNIRAFVEDILTHDDLGNTKVVLITPPPINVPEPHDTADGGLGPAFAQATKEWKDPKQDRAYMTWASKRRYAERILEIAREYGETGRVVGLDLWNAIVQAGLDEQGRKGEQDEDTWPGCGLPGAKEFGKGWFTDGLHMDVKAYNVLSGTLMETVTSKWPELSPGVLGT